MTTALDPTQRATLDALCNTFVPALPVKPDPSGFWARTASDMGVPDLIAQLLTVGLPPAEGAALIGILDVLAAQGFDRASQQQREKILAQVSASSPDAARGVLFYEKQTLLLFYGVPEAPPGNPQKVTYGTPEVPNPNWEVVGYPGPATAPPPHKPKDIKTIVPDADAFELEADACIVGSGAGGAVIASRLAEQGLRVVVLEMGAHYNSADFHQLELWSYKHLWYRGGATLTANGTVNLLAGSTLGGGTEINWMNCIRTPELIRNDWVERFGLDGVNSPEFEGYIDAVEDRLSVNGETALWNDQNLRMREGCLKLDYLTRRTRINWDPETFNSLLAGYTGLGDQTGAKQTARRTFLRDAYSNGTRFLVDCRVDRILHQNGQATGVEATYNGPDGRQTKVVVRAPHVVVACGALESPALLLRTGIGGPAVGKYLHVQPGGAVYGVYEKKQRGWWGSPMTANCEEFVDTGDSYGFYMEIPAFAPGFYASVIPWSSGREHKELMTKVPYISTFIWFLRDKGHGEVTLDEAGEAKITYQLDNPVDQKNFRHATAEAIRIHEAAGAQEIIFGLSNGVITWRRGQSLDQFLRTVEKQPLLDGAQPIISAHQLSTCRLGDDPQTSVGDTNGELRDVKGVWIGDASACPTALGANPMITIMALAERTATRILRRAGKFPDRPGHSRASDQTGYVPGTTYSLDPPHGGGGPWSGGPAKSADAAGDLMRGMLGLMTLPFRMATAMGEQMLAGASRGTGGEHCEHCGGQSSGGSCPSCGEPSR